MCIPDQAKLVEFDNAKITQIKENEKNFEDFNEKLQELKSLLITEKKGGPRMNFSSNYDLTEIKSQIEQKKITIDRLYYFEKKQL